MTSRYKSTRVRLPEGVTQVLAEEDSLTADRSWRRVHRRPSNVQDYLRWLIDVDLLVFKDQRCFCHGTVLRYWVARLKRHRIRRFSQPQRIYSAWSMISARGLHGPRRNLDAKESEVRNSCASWLVAPFQAALRAGESRCIWCHALPVEPYPVQQDGQVEIDALAENEESGWSKSNGSWLCGRKELEQMLCRSPGQRRPRMVCLAGRLRPTPRQQGDQRILRQRRRSSLHLPDSSAGTRSVQPIVGAAVAHLDKKRHRWPRRTAVP